MKDKQTLWDKIDYTPTGLSDCVFGVLSSLDVKQALQELKVELIESLYNDFGDEWKIKLHEKRFNRINKLFNTKLGKEFLEGEKE